MYTRTCVLPHSNKWTDVKKVFKSTGWDRSHQLTDKKKFDNLQSPITKMVEPQKTEGSPRFDSAATENPTCAIELKLKHWTRKYKMHSPLTWFVLALNVLAYSRKKVCLSNAEARKQSWVRRSKRSTSKPHQISMYFQWTNEAWITLCIIPESMKHLGID